MKAEIYNKKTKQKFIVTKEATDPLCLRVSLGGNKNIGYYLTFRGDSLQDIEDMLSDSLHAFKIFREQVERPDN